MTKLVAYLAHPVGPDQTLEQRARRRENIANARAWLEWLVSASDLAICVPWLPYVETLDESHRDRGVADDLAILERCDLVILTGGEVSRGMALEAELARAWGMPIIDLTVYGYTPPVSLGDAAINGFRNRLDVAFPITRRRRIVTAISALDRDELKGARALLTAAGQSTASHDILIDRIEGGR